jgi:hypothetical protein
VLTAVETLVAVDEPSAGDVEPGGGQGEELVPVEPMISWAMPKPEELVIAATEPYVIELSDGAEVTIEAEDLDDAGRIAEAALLLPPGVEALRAHRRACRPHSGTAAQGQPHLLGLVLVRAVHLVVDADGMALGPFAG